MWGRLLTIMYQLLGRKYGTSLLLSRRWINFPIAFSFCLLRVPLWRYTHCSYMWALPLLHDPTLDNVKEIIVLDLGLVALGSRTDDGRGHAIKKMAEVASSFVDSATGQFLHGPKQRSGMNHCRQGGNAPLFHPRSALLFHASYIHLSFSLPSLNKTQWWYCPRKGNKAYRLHQHQLHQWHSDERRRIFIILLITVKESHRLPHLLAFFSLWRV